MTYDQASGSLVTPDGWLALDCWTGQSLRQLPLTLREPDEALTHCESVAAVVGTGCDPRSGGIAGTGHLAQHLGVSAQQFRRYLLPQMPFVRDLGGIPVSNVASLSGWVANYRVEVRRKWRRNLGMGEG